MDRQDRKETIAQMHRDNILLASKELFMANGFDKTTMDDISKKAQYSKRTIYLHFQSKDEIYSYLVLQAFDSLKDKLNDALASSNDFMEQYHGICQALSTLRAESPEYYNAVISFQGRQFNGEDKTDVEKKILVSSEEIYQILQNFFRNAQDEGIIIANLDLKKTVFIIWNGIISLVSTAADRLDYIKEVLQTTPEEYQSFGFILLLNAILATEN